MKRLILAMAIAAGLPGIAGAACTLTTGKIVLEKPRANDTGPVFIGCINRTLDILASSAAVLGSTQPQSIPMLVVSTIAARDSVSYIFVSSYIRAGSSMSVDSYFTVGVGTISAVLGQVKLASTTVTGTLTSSGQFMVGSSTLTATVDGWVVMSGTMSATQLSGCGAGATFGVGSGNNAGKITVQNTGATSCVFTFKTAEPNARAPACTVTNETTANLVRATSTSSQVTFAGNTNAGDVLAYTCTGL